MERFRRSPNGRGERGEFFGSLTRRRLTIELARIGMAASGELERLSQDRRADVPGRRSIRPRRPPSASPSTRSIARPATGYAANSSTRRPASRSRPTTRSRATRSGKGEYVMLEPERDRGGHSRKRQDARDRRLHRMRRRSTTSISIARIISRPSDRIAEEAFALIREGMREQEGRGPRPHGPVSPRADLALATAMARA